MYVHFTFLDITLNLDTHLTWQNNTLFDKTLTKKISTGMLETLVLILYYILADNRSIIYIFSL